MDKVSPYRKSDNWTYFNETATTAEGDPDTLADNEKAVSNYGNAEISTQRTYHLIPVTLSAGDTLTIQGKTDGYAESESALGMTIYDNTPAQLQAL